MIFIYIFVTGVLAFRPGEEVFRMDVYSHSKAVFNMKPVRNWKEDELAYIFNENLPNTLNALLHSRKIDWMAINQCSLYRKASPFVQNVVELHCDGDQFIRNHCGLYAIVDNLRMSMELEATSILQRLFRRKLVQLPDPTLALYLNGHRKKGYVPDFFEANYRGLVYITTW